MTLDTNITALILPGIGNSDAVHWQSRWQASDKNFVRVNQRDWSHPDRLEWVDTLEQAVTKHGELVVLVAHSLGCLLVAHWVAQTRLKIKGALLVAPPSPEAAPSAAIFSTVATGFLPIPMQAISFPSIVVASANDPYSDLDYAKSWARVWGSRFVNIGDAGHINTSSGLGDWQDGLDMYKQLAAS